MLKGKRRDTPRQTWEKGQWRADRSDGRRTRVGRQREEAGAGKAENNTRGRIEKDEGEEEEASVHGVSRNTFCTIASSKRKPFGPLLMFTLAQTQIQF